MKKTTTTTVTVTTGGKGQAPPAQSKFNTASYVGPGVTQAEVNEIKKAFDLFDSDQGGSIDTNQLKAAMISLGFDVKFGTICQMISDLDEDGNKEIDFNEWFHLMTNRVAAGSSKESIRKVFPLYDDEKTEHISVKNLRRVAMDLAEHIEQQQLQQMIDRADLDRDGLVNFEEFYTILTRKMKD